MPPAVSVSKEDAISGIPKSSQQKDFLEQELYSRVLGKIIHALTREV
jgi:hypothetical protein